METPRKAEAAGASALRRGLLFLDDILEKLREYEENRSKYPTLESFYPKLLSFLEKHVE